jgi:hypothetical protein
MPAVLEMDMLESNFKVIDNFIETEILNTPNTVLNEVIDNFEVRLQHIHLKNGWHIKHILS